MTLSMFELKTECFEKGNIGHILHASHNNRRKASGDWGKWPIDYVQTEGNQILCIRAPASEKDEQITQLSSHSHLQQTLRENFFLRSLSWSEKYVYWLPINRFSRFFGLQQVTASANVASIKGVVRLKGRVWRFLSIALVKEVLDCTTVPGRSTNVWKGAISDGYCQPLLLPRALARTRLHSVVVDGHDRRGASVDGAGIRQVQSQPKPRASLSSLEYNWGMWSSDRPRRDTV